MQKQIDNGKNLMKMHNIDIMNRLWILTSKPIYGSDCLRACEIELAFSSINSNKARISLKNKNLILPSSVFNPCISSSEWIEHIKSDEYFISKNITNSKDS